MRCLLFWTPGPAVSGERTHVCESGLSVSMGEAGKTGHVCVHPCGPHLRASGKHREAVTPRTPEPCPFLLALSCPGGARGQKGPRGALVHRAGQRHRPTPTDTDRRRPPCPPTCSPNLRQQQALPGSHDTGNVAAVTPASGALPRAWWPNRSLRGSRQRSPGRDRLTAAAGWLPTLPRADPYPWEARAQRGPFLRPGQAGLGAGSRPGGPAGRGDPDNRQEDGSWEDLPGQLREKARSSAIPEARTQAAQRAGPCSRADLGI